MTSPELLRFFHAEAREYLDAVEGLVSGNDAEAAPFDAGAFVAASRALRGSATMARVPRVAEIALAMERVANGVRDGEIEWSPGLRRDLGETVIDLRRFVVTSSSWTSEDDRQAMDRLAALRTLLPVGKTTPPSPPAGTTPIFIALQASAIATDLENFLRNPVDRGLVDDVVNRLRSLRGIAGVADHPPLGEVADAVERALRELTPDAMLRETDNELLGAAAGVFRRASSELRSRGQFERSTGEVDRFARAAAAASDAPQPMGDAPVIRIEELFYTDMGPHLVQRGTAPSRSAEARFREDVITRAEHLRRLVAEARVAMDPFTRERVRRDLKAHLARLDEFARSYGAQQVASVVGEAAARESFVEPVILDAIEDVARILMTPGLTLDEMERRLAIGERKRWTPMAAPAAPAAPAPAAPARATPAPAAPVPVSPAAPAAGFSPPATEPARRPPQRPEQSSPRSGRALKDMLGASLSQLAGLESAPLAEPTPLDDDAIVPVESLIYRGPAALDRARALRDSMRTQGSVDPDALHELYELLDLARTE